MIVLGLTGPTGAGKGAVAARLQQAGALIIDTDRIAREVVEPGQPCLAALADAFGPAILSSDGTLDRAALAAVAFAIEDAHTRLNQITHPFIIRRSLDILESAAPACAVIDAPLLFESGMDRLCDTTIAVLAPKDVRLNRIMMRDAISRERALARMNAQPDDAFYRERAAHILINDTDLSTLHAKTDALLRTVWEDTL